MPPSDRANVRTEIQGLEDLLSTLDKISADVRTNIIADMVKEGAKPLVKSIKNAANTSKDSGALQDSIGMVVKKQRSKGTALAIVGPRWGSFGRSGTLAGEEDQPARRAHLIEFGHADRSGSGHVAAKPFMGPGTSSAIGAVTLKMTLGAQKGLTKAAKKHAKRLDKQ